MRQVSVALVHYPVLARDGQVVTTSITNLDLHDIARSAFTYGIEQYFVVHPIAAQRELAQRIVDHWTHGSGARRIPDRKPPMEQLRIVDSLQTVHAALGAGVEIWVTSARPMANTTDCGTAAQRLETDGPPVLLVFGTGWGLAPEVLESRTVALHPIVSPRADGYNHLSVRAAAAIYFDRLLGGSSR